MATTLRLACQQRLSILETGLFAGPYSGIDPASALASMSPAKNNLLLSTAQTGYDRQSRMLFYLCSLWSKPKDLDAILTRAHAENQNYFRKFSVHDIKNIQSG